MTTCKGIIIYLVRKECMREGYFVRMPAPVSNSKWFKLEELFPERTSWSPLFGGSLSILQV